jgi:hypothetical protein
MGLGFWDSNEKENRLAYYFAGQSRPEPLCFFWKQQLG